MKIWLVALLSVSACAFAVTDSADWSDSGIWGPKYRAILAEMHRLQNLNPDLVQVEAYGKSVQGKSLELLVVQRQGVFRERPTLLMTGSTHGNEYLNIEDRLPERLVSAARVPGEIADFLDQGGTFVFVPVVNPDGYDARLRDNANGVDLNRDWDIGPAGFKGFKEVETRSLAKKLDDLEQQRRLSYRITVDYHCCAGALLHPWAFKKTQLPATDAAKHAAISQMAAEILGIEAGNTVDILGYEALGTTKDYYYSHYGALAFTYEGRQTVEKTYLPKHLIWWRKMAALVAEEINRPFLAFLKNRPHPFFRFAD